MRLETFFEKFELFAEAPPLYSPLPWLNRQTNRMRARKGCLMNTPKMPYYSQMMSFRKDIDEIARDLIDAFKLKFSEKNKNANSPLFRWLDFRSRYIDPKPRKTLKPDGFDARVPIEAVSALSDFIIKFCCLKAGLPLYLQKQICAGHSHYGQLIQ